MRALLVTHGRLGEELLASAACIYDVEAPIEYLSNRDLDAAELQRRIRAWLDREDGPVLVFVDVGGGSCGTAAQIACAGRDQSWVLGGVNLAMVLTYLGSHGQLDPPELVSKILDRALNAVRLLDGGG
jgi:mannose/fructose-specific phosphotransferase system component IIA